MFREYHRIQFHHSNHSSSVHKGAIGKVVFDSKAERFAVACTLYFFQFRKTSSRSSIFDFFKKFFHINQSINHLFIYHIYEVIVDFF